MRGQLARVLEKDGRDTTNVDRVLESSFWRQPAPRNAEVIAVDFSARAKKHPARPPR